MTTNTQRAEALLHLVLRISAIRTDRDVTMDVMHRDLSITRNAARIHGNDAWHVTVIAEPTDGAERLFFEVCGTGESVRAAMDDALADYADKLMTAARIRMDWAEEEGEAL